LKINIPETTIQNIDDSDLYLIAKMNIIEYCQKLKINEEHLSQLLEDFHDFLFGPPELIPHLDVLQQNEYKF
jgi:hypothetical protein